jgi:hypothetical protein
MNSRELVSDFLSFDKSKLTVGFDNSQIGTLGICNPEIIFKSILQSLISFLEF